MARLKLVDFLLEAPKASNIVIDNDTPSKVKLKKDVWSSGKNIHQDLDDLKYQESEYEYQDLDNVEAKESAWEGGENLVNPVDYEKVKKMLEACGCEGPDMSNDYYKMREEGPHWHGPGCESKIPSMDSYRAVGDILIRNPDLISFMLEPLMNEAGADCPASTAMALADISDLYKRGQG